MRILLHICCAPCSVMCVKTLQDAGHKIVGYWYNPNIHPATEYLARRDQMIAYAQAIGLELVVDDFYGLEPFLKNVIDDIDNRCEYCYRERLQHTAKKAKALGLDAFTSTLFISPYQRHELLRKQAELVALEEEICFHYVDFRPYYREGREYARKQNFYLQKYCGCVFSEQDRYQKKLSQKPWG